MTEAKHTPGPWTTNEWHDEDWNCYHEEDGTSSHKQIHAASGRVVAFAAYHTHKLWGTHKEDEEMQANARLIAAAPELLEASMKVLEWFEAEDDHSKADFYQRMQMCRDAEEMIRTAIAKATGN